MLIQSDVDFVRFIQIRIIIGSRQKRRATSKTSAFNFMRHLIFLYSDSVKIPSFFNYRRDLRESW